MSNLMSSAYSRLRSTWGFTMVELIIVMVVIGIIAAIAVPTYQNQQRQAVDAAVKSDLQTFSKEIAMYYVHPVWSKRDAPRIWTNNYLGYRAIQILWVIPGTSSWYTYGWVRLSEPNTRTGGRQWFNSAEDWCLTLTNNDGDIKTFHMRSGEAVAKGECPTP